MRDACIFSMPLSDLLRCAGIFSMPLSDLLCCAGIFSMPRIHHIGQPHLMNRKN